MSETLRIAIAQSAITPDINTNGTHVRALMEQASKEGARMVHFPEGALSGYVNAQIDDWTCVDWTSVKRELQNVMETARLLGLWVAIGCNHKLTEPNRPHNSLYVIADSGKIATRYDKRFCSNAEISDWYSPGGEARTFEIDGVRFGCAMCIEIQFMEVFSEYESMDTDCILFSAYSEDPMFWVQAQAYAAANNLWFSVSTPAQCSGKLASGFIGPDGDVISRLNTDCRPEIQIVDLDKSAPEMQIPLTKARPWRRKARAGKIYEPGVSEDPRSKDLSSI